MHVKAVIFDWGGVLIDDPSSAIIAHYAQELHVSEKECQDVLWRFFGDFQKGVITEQLLWKRVCEHVSNTSVAHVTPWADVVRKTFLDKQDVHDLVMQLRFDGLRTGLLSNTEMPTTEYFFERGYEHMFDAVVFSCIENLLKPDPRIYEIIVNRLRVMPGECIFIDDKEIFVNGAKSIGMNGIVFDDVEQVIREIKNISSTPSL